MEWAFVLLLLVVLVSIGIHLKPNTEVRDLRSKVKKLQEQSDTWEQIAKESLSSWSKTIDKSATKTDRIRELEVEVRTLNDRIERLTNQARAERGVYS